MGTATPLVLTLGGGADGAVRAYVRPAASIIGTTLAVDIRGTQYPANVVKLPFYERSKKN